MGGGMGSGVARKSVGMVGRAAALLLLVLAVGCSPIVRNAGYVPSDEDLSQINVGVDTRETVAAAVGVPGTGGVVETGGYYYVRSRWETRGPFAPQEVDRQVVAISFGADGTVSNIERFTLEDGRVIEQGPYRELIAADGSFARLVRTQYGAAALAPAPEGKSTLEGGST